MLSVIIPTCNRNELLALCLDRLKPGAQNLDITLYEVIVSDDSKSNEAKQFIERYYSWVTWIEGPKKGPAANRNNGARLAKADWLVFTDDDCLPDFHWLNAYYEAIKLNKEFKAFEGAILPDSWELLKKDMAECPVNDKGGCFWSANIMIEKKLFKSIGGFDERFTIAAQEDQDLFMKIKKQANTIFITDAIVIHPVRKQKFIIALKKMNSSTENYLLYASKNLLFLGYKNLRIAIWKSGIKYQAICSWKYFITGRYKQALLCLINCFLYTGKLITSKK